MSSQAPRVLLVDDDPGTIHVLRGMLAQDHELRYALNGEAALELAVRWLPELVLLDAQMPGITGTEVCRRLKSDARTAHIPVIFVTSLDQSGAELLSIELDAQGVVNKPMDEAQLRQAIAMALGGSPPGAQVPLPSGEPNAPGLPKILIVDDDPAAVQTVHAALQDLHARFFFATSGEHCLVLARQHLPDLILLDMYMPGLDGLSTLQALTSEPTLAETQVAIITRFAYPEMETRALEAGGVDFIAKPYTQAVLKARVNNLLRLREQKRQARAVERVHWQRIGNAKLARVVAAALDAIVTADAEQRIVLINAAACELFGVDAARVIGSPLPLLIPELVLPADADVVTRQRLAITAQGRQLQMAVSVSRLTLGDGQLTTVVLHDLSEHERALAAERAKGEAEASLRAKTMALSYIAHEVGNPLASIIGLTQLLQSGDTGLPADRRDELLKHMNESGQHLMALMRDVLDLQRIEAGRFDLKPRALDPAEYLQRAAHGLTAEAQAAGVTLVRPRIDSPCRVLADETRLMQCLINLISNAVKYNRPGGQVRMEARMAMGAGDARVQIDFTDDGPGLSPEQIQRIFEPFNRLGRTDQRGAGIGLALTRMLAVAMGGTLSVVSEPGHGSCFTLELPAAAKP